MSSSCSSRTDNMISEANHAAIRTSSQGPATASSSQRHRVYARDPPACHTPPLRDQGALTAVIRMIACQRVKVPLKEKFPRKTEALCGPLHLQLSSAMIDS